MNFSDLLPNRERPLYREEGAVRHLDASVLQRPFDPPRQIRVACIIGALVAAIIASYFAYQAIDEILYGAEREATTIEENINRGVSYDFPEMVSLVALDDDAILQQLEDAGYLTYKLSDDEEDLDVMKLPSDVTLTDAAVALAGGISSMDAVTASEYLVGSWRLITNHSSGVTMSLRYSDLQASDAEEAIRTALDSQGWTIDEGTEFEIDSAGNTYVTGSVESDAGTYTWRVAACDLSDVYGISGLPDTAQYVGVHITLN